MINEKEIRIGDFVTHNKAGRIEVDSIFLHCETYAVGYKGGWVYLHNCTNLEKK